MWKTSSKHYEVGHGKPPEHSRFKKGQSGNPKGRPSGTKNLKTDLTEELQESVLVREGARATKISKQRAIVKTLVAKTLKGDAHAATTVTNMMYRLLDHEDAAADAEEPLSADETEVLNVLRERLLRTANPIVTPANENAAPEGTVATTAAATADGGDKAAPAAEETADQAVTERSAP